MKYYENDKYIVGKRIFDSGLYPDTLDGENGFLGDYLFASGDSVYFIKYTGGGDIVTRINVKNSFATSTISLGYYVSVDNKMTKDNKMFTVSKSNNLKQIDVYDFETKQVSRVFYDSTQIEYVGFLDDAIVI